MARCATSSGVLPLARLARERRIRRLYVPADDAPEAALIPDVEVYPIGSLAELINHLLGSAPLQPLQPTVPLDDERSPLDYKADFSLIRGQEHAKRALEVAASGGHNVMLSGPPGTGKTLMARSLPSILPRMGLEEQLEVTSIYSVADQLPAGHPAAAPPSLSRAAPHHLARRAGRRRLLAQPG